MKATTKLVIFLVFLGIQSIQANIDVPKPFGTIDRIIKVRNLPDSPQFQLKDGTYFDIGSMYESKHIFGLSYWNSTPEYVGYIGSQDEYVDLTPEALNDIIASTRIILPINAKTSFFDKFISGPLLLLLLVGIVLFIRKMYLKDRLRQASEGKEDILPWPPTQIHE